MNLCRFCKTDVPESSRFCPACGHSLAQEHEVTASLSARDAVDELGVSRHPSRTFLFDLSDHGDLLPGTKIANRYRVVSLVGKGGMGEVYRADDLKLGYTVALKFLPKDLASDPRRLAYFHDEVRLARQISHPNVCRVFDIGEAEGQHFLSMEFIDGEDLRVLLRRIGRLPKDKGIEIAQQLCAGLAAAHEKGVLHRDLKPANIMLDGRGQVRITDYGLARSANEERRAEEVAGTPTYMAYEQLAHGATSIQSDLYSLGLILYEVFTGRKVHEFGSLADLMRAHEESSVTPPSVLTADMDPAVERVILKCLEKDPWSRPRSAKAVAAALPSADPLAAAQAAGETPSPGMVAAAGEGGEISPTVAAVCLTAVAIGLLVVSLIAQRTMVVNRAPMELPPDSLMVKAKEIIKRLGYTGPPAYSARGFVDAPADREAVKQAELPEGVTDRWSLLKTGPWPGVLFWYRQSPEPMLVTEFWDTQGQFSRTRVSPQLPPWVLPGMAGIRLDPRGKLRWFRAIPPSRRADVSSPSHGTKLLEPGSDELTEGADPSDLPWHSWFRDEELGFHLETSSEKGRNPKKLSIDEIRQADWLRTPPDAYDHFAAWKGTWPDTALPLYVEAATFRGRPVYFEILPPTFTEVRDASGASGPAIDTAILSLSVFINIFILVGELLLAGRNLRLGRGDRRGALRLAQYIFVAGLLSWVFRASHVGGPLEWVLFSNGVAQALMASALVWLDYISLEPFVRRFWPQSLISWARLLNGRLQDSLVGRDILLGTLLGVLVSILIKLGRLIPGLLGLQSSLEPLPRTYPMDATSLIGAILELHLSSISTSLMLLSMLLLLRILFRSVRIAALGFLVLNTSFFCLAEIEPNYSMWFFISLAVALYVWVLVRFGLLTAVMGVVVLSLLTLPVTLDSSAFYFGNGLLVLGLTFSLAVYGFITSVSGRPLFRDT